MKRLTRLSVAAVSGLSLFTGVAAAATSTVDTTGPSSRVNIDNRDRTSSRVDNDVRANVTNSNPQTARTGDVRANNNTTAGDAMSGAASNDGLLRASLTVDQGSGAAAGVSSGSGAGHSTDVGNTGPNSHVTVNNSSSWDSTVHNSTNLSVNNSNTQNATSGNAHVSGNTTGGNAQSGDASNISTTDVTLNVTQ